MQKIQFTAPPCSKTRGIRHGRPLQTGVSLIELMVGISIGLLTVSVALGALMASRGISSTVSEVSQMQQQAAYAFRVIGQQLRQAGSVELNLAYNKTDEQKKAEPPSPLERVAFEANNNRKDKTIKGNDSPGANEFRLELSYQNYKEPNFAGSEPESFFRNCLGEGADPGTNPLIENKFTQNTKNELVCQGSGNKAQAIIKNVSDFKVTYLTQDKTINPTEPTIKKATAANVGSEWRSVFGVQICLELTGEETINTADDEYIDCSGTKKSRGNKLRMVFRNTYQLRSQGSPV